MAGVGAIQRLDDASETRCTPPTTKLLDVIPPNGRKTILICEDEEPLRELVRVALGPAHRYFDVADGTEALPCARKVRPDLVVLDLMLPRKSGLDVLAELRSDPVVADTPVVVITAWAHARTEVVAAGADGFVSKPFEPEELRVIVDELLTEG